MNLDFKSYQILKNFTTKEYHPKLAQFLSWWGDEFYEIIITSAWRATGFHSTGRAVDLRSWIYANPSGMEKYVNDQWVYDPNRPHYKVCVLHDVGKGDHFHIQVHDRTIRDGGKSKGCNKPDSDTL